MDRSEHKQSEDDQAMLASIVMNSVDAIISKDLNGIIKSWNLGAQRLFGYTAQEIIGHPITLLIPAEQRIEEQNILLRLSKGEQIEHFDTVRLTKNQQRIDVSVSSSPIIDKQGRIIGAAKIIRGIADRKQAETALKNSELQYRRLFETAQDGILITQ